MKSTRNGHRKQMDCSLLERLASLEHDQWIYYSKDVSKRIQNAHSLRELQKQTHLKWSQKWVPYENLEEIEKEKDRIWAKKVLNVLKRAK